MESIEKQHVSMGDWTVCEIDAINLTIHPQGFAPVEVELVKAGPGDQPDLVCVYWIPKAATEAENDARLQAVENMHPSYRVDASNDWEGNQLVSLYRWPASHGTDVLDRSVVTLAQIENIKQREHART